MYNGIYKCRICGKIYTRCGTYNKDLVINNFIKLTTRVTVQQEPGYADLYDMHSCENGSFGLADFQGYEKDD